MLENSKRGWNFWESLCMMYHFQTKFSTYRSEIVHVFEPVTSDDQIPPRFDQSKRDFKRGLFNCEEGSHEELHVFWVGEKFWNIRPVGELSCKCFIFYLILLEDHQFGKNISTFRSKLWDPNLELRPPGLNKIVFNIESRFKPFDI